MGKRKGGVVMETTKQCECGCGKSAARSPQTDTKRGYVRGKPRRFIIGHNTPREDDPGYELSASGCWLWKGKVQYNGYGKMGGRWMHRHYYETFVGPILGGMVLDHLCGVRNCVNPDHLEAVTQLENVRRAEKGGLKNRKLTPYEVSEIRRSSLSQETLARRHGVVQATISRIRARKCYQEVA